MNIDLAVVLSLADKDKSQPFDDYVAKIVNRMLDNSPEDKAFLGQFSLHYYLADNKHDASIARVVDADYADDMQSLCKGKNFAVALNKDVLLKLDSEDALAFVLGHELSHIMYQKNCDKVKALSSDEELACDYQALKLLDVGGYSLLEIAKVDALYPQKSCDMAYRVSERDNFIQQNFDVYSRIGMMRPLQKETFAHLEKEPWARKDIFAQGTVGADKIVEELGDIYQNGDRTVFHRNFNKYLNTMSTEEASKLMMNVLAQSCEKFSQIEEVRTNESYRKYRNHPIAVMSNIVFEQYRRPGKKLFPPKDMQIISKYMQKNQFYFENKDEKFWRQMREGMTPVAGMPGNSR